jgi:hypothetical protein
VPGSRWGSRDLGIGIGHGEEVDLLTLGSAEQQIPCGNDNKKDNGKSKGGGGEEDKSRFPAGMTTRRATAKAKAMATATEVGMHDSLRIAAGCCGDAELFVSCAVSR